MLCSVSFSLYSYVPHRHLHSFPTRRSSDLDAWTFYIFKARNKSDICMQKLFYKIIRIRRHLMTGKRKNRRSEEHTSELQSRGHLVCRLLLEKKKKNTK